MRKKQSPDGARGVTDNAKLPSPKRTKIPRGSKRGSALVQVVGCPAPMSLLHSTSVMSPQYKKRKSASVEPEHSVEEAWKQQALPTNLSLLQETFVAVQTVYEVLRHRNKRATYENLKPGVEASTGRRFLESHLRQLHHLLPEHVSLHTISLPSYSGSRTMVAHTALTLVPPSGESFASLRSLFRQRLVEYLLTTCNNGSDGSAGGKSISLSQIRSIFPQGVPEVPEVGSIAARDAFAAEIGPLAQTSNMNGDEQEETPEKPIVSGGRLSLSDCGILVETRGSEQRSSGKSNNIVSVPHAESSQIAPRKQRRLSFNALIGVEKPEADSVQQSRQPNDSFLENLPLELRRRSVDGVISFESLQKLEENEALHRRLSTSEARSARELSAAISSLPHIFSSIRRIFGPRGPGVMKLDNLVCRLLDGGPELSSESEIRTAVKLLVQHAPDFVQIKPWGSCGTPAVWINRRCDMKGTAEQLKALSLR